jgi:hypothetical protein
LKKLAIFVVLASSLVFGQSTPPPNGQLIATDTFVRANAATLGANWEENPNATYVWSISTNTAIKSTGQFNADAVYWIGSTVPDNQWASVRIASVSNTNQGAAVRVTQGTTAARNNGYRVMCAARSSSTCTQVIAYKVTNSASTAIITVNSANITSWTTKYIQISAEGSSPTTVKIYVDGTQIGTDYVDSTDPWTTGRPGMMTSSTTAISAGAGANYFEAGSMGSSAVAPVYSPVAGTFTAPTSVTITSATSGATICYTTDGGTPAATAGTCTTGSTYSSAVSLGTQGVSETKVLKSIASKSGMDNSGVTSGNYVFQFAANPTFSSAQPGTYFAEQFVELGCSTSSPTIRYTTDGSTPTGSSTVYAALSPPNITSVSNAAGGFFSIQNYFYKVTATNAQGESLAGSRWTKSNSVADQQFTVTWSAVPGATGYKVYRSTEGVGVERYIAATTETSYVDNGSITPSGDIPTQNTTAIPTGTTGTKTIKAICQASGYGDSNVLSGQFLMNPDPVTLASDDFTSHFQSAMDAISVPGYPLDTWWTNGRWRSNTTWKLTASRVPSSAFIKAGGAGHGPTATGDTTVSGIASYSGRSFPNDQWSKGKISGTQDAGVCVRMSTIGIKTGYCFRIARLAGAANLYKYVSEAETSLANPSLGAIADGDDIEIRVIGSQLFAYFKGSIVASVTDSAITSGNPGILAHKEHSRTANSTSNPNSGIYSWSAGGFGSAPASSTVYISEGTIPESYSDPLTSSWTGLGKSAPSTSVFPWVSGAAELPTAGSPPSVWGAEIKGYSNAGISGVGLNTPEQWMSSTTMQYRQPFGDSQWEQVKITADSSQIGLNNWFLMLKSQLYIPGQADGGCTAGGTAAVCFDHVAYYLGVQTMATSIYTSNRSAICQAFQGVKTEYSCTPFLHITKVTPARNDDAVISVVGSLYTPMSGDYVRGEYDRGRLRAYCKNGHTYASWQATHAYAKGDVVLDTNGNLQIVKTAGTSGGSQPIWDALGEWDPYLEGTTIADGSATWMYFGEPCPTTNSWSLVFEVIDTDLDGLGGYPGLFLGGATAPNGSNAGWNGSGDATNWPKAIPFFTDWSAGTLGDYGRVAEVLNVTANVSDTVSTSEDVTSSTTAFFDAVSWMNWGPEPGSDPFAACLVNTTGMTPITGPTNITVSGNYFVQDNLSCAGTCVSVNANDVHLYLQGKTLTYGTNPATFTNVDSDGATITVGSPSEQALPRPGTTLTDGSFATVTDISNTITCSDATTKTRGVNYRLGVDSFTGDPRGFIWMSGKPAVGVTCTIPSYTYTYPRFGIYNSISDTYTRATGNTTGGGSGMTVSCGTIQPSINAPAFNMPIWVSNKTTPTISDMVLYGRGWSAPAIGLSYVAGATVQNNTVSCDSATSGVFNRNQYEGYCIWNKNNSTALSGQKSIFSGNTVLDSVQGGITQDQDNSEIYGNTITTRSRYTNDFAINAQRTGTKVYNNTILNYSATDAEVSGRGVRAATNGEIYSNVIKVHGAPNNYEYGGCQAGDVYGIQAEGVTGTSIHDNVIESYARTCDARGLRITSTGGITVTNNTIKALRHDSSATGVAIGISAREAIGTTVGSNTIESDTWIIEDESQTTASNPSNITYRGTTFKKGPTPAAGFHAWSPQNYAQLAATSATHTCIDCVVENSASLSDVTAHAITSYWKQYDIWVKWTYTVNVKVGGVNTSGFLVTLTDAQSNQYQGTTDASGNAAIEVPQYRFYNTAGAAVVTENHNAYSLSITKTGCDALTASGINVTGTTTDNRTTACPGATLMMESGNNTSASVAFTGDGWTNGTLGAGNVSKENVHSLLYSGHTAKIYAHIVAWFGTGSHQSVGYDNNTTAQATTMVADMKSRGIDGVIHDWYGSSTNSEQVASKVITAANAAGNFQYATMIDVGAFSCVTAVGCAGQLIEHLQALSAARFLNPAYMKVNSRPMVFFFSLPSPGIDWATVYANADVQTINPYFILENEGAFTNADAHGAYSWVTNTFADPDGWGETYLQSFYTKAKQNPSKFAFGSVKPGFDDTEASWGQNRILQQDCGDTWLQTWNLINTNYSTSTQLYGVQLVTWDDYEEGSSLETGIDNCVAFTAFSGTGTTLNWTISGAENTLARFEVFSSTDGSNLMKLADVAASARSFGLASYNLSGTRQFYVKAIGKPMFRNKVSSAVTLTL